MKFPAAATRAGRRRLCEVRAAHGLLDRLFPDAAFPSGEFSAALSFAESQGGAREIAPPSQAIGKLVEWYGREHPGVACRIVDAEALAGGLLWLQSALDRIVRELQRGRPAVLFVTGLRECVRHSGRRWSPVAERERTDGLYLLEERVARWSKETATPVSLFVS